MVLSLLRIIDKLDNKILKRYKAFKNNKCSLNIRKEEVRKQTQTLAQA